MMGTILHRVGVSGGVSASPPLWELLPLPFNWYSTIKGLSTCCKINLMALPLKSKNQMSLITHELMAFTKVLGHGEVQYYADNEPTLRQILRLLVAARSAIGLRTTMRTTKMYDSAGNSLVENSIQRIRSLAATLMEDLAGRIGLRFSSQHPLWTWACRHSAWLLNKFQAGRGATSHELVHGKAYEGKVSPYGEV